jgi:MFS family permease
LGDKFERRTLIITLLFASCISLLLFATAQTVLVLSLASFAMGACAANVHVVVPFAAFLSTPDQRGRVVGTMVGGILFGVLLARTFSGALGAWFGWRVVYFIAAGMMLVLAAVVRARLPVNRPHKFISWSELMLSTLHLVQRHAVLRESAFLGALLFGAFSAFWTTLVFLLESPTYGYANASLETRPAYHHPLRALAGARLVSFARCNGLAFCGTDHRRHPHGYVRADRACGKPDAYLRHRQDRPEPAEHGLHVFVFHRRRHRFLPWRRLLALVGLVGRVRICERSAGDRHPRGDFARQARRLTRVA